jgi:hypothetical protein
MTLEVHSVACEHPFGDGIHVLVLRDPDIIQTIFIKMGINSQMKAEYLLLRRMSNESGKAACKCGAYPGKIPEGMAKCYAVVRMLVKPGDEFDFNVTVLLIEEGYEELGQRVAEQMRIALKNL